MDDTTTESEVKCIVCREPVLATQSQFGYGSEVVYHKHCDGVFNDIEKAVTARLERRTSSLAEGREHITTSGEFRSDKYSWCADGFVPLKLTDASAWPLLRAYADVRASIDSEFSNDLHEALDLAGAPR